MADVAMKLQTPPTIIVVCLVWGLSGFGDDGSGTPGGIAAAPYPPSPVIAGIDWAPPETIVRRAKGSDNFPLTWSDDDALYTTYGDGFGFEPLVPAKLSLGLARITGMPDDFQGVNLRSDSIEQYGDGRKGMKGWGLLSVNGALYLWMGHADHNGGQARLAWSKDHGAAWTYADWRFEEFGLVGFVNFGKDYAGARDAFIYAYSHDGPKADGPADRFILMRVPQDRITQRAAWQFFVRRDEQGRPVWSHDIRQRGGVFEHRDACLRSAMTYNAGIKRYLWWQAVPQPPGHKDRGDTRFDGGFGVYDAAEPWGPWTTAFFTPQWDAGPGEHGDFPSKWMSADGRTLYLVFSGDDHFCVRKATLRLLPLQEQQGLHSPLQGRRSRQDVRAAARAAEAGWRSKVMTQNVLFILAAACVCGAGLPAAERAAGEIPANRRYHGLSRVWRMLGHEETTATVG